MAETTRKIRRALISVYDKTGIVEFARALVNEFSIEIISTGGTAKLLTENNIPVTLVEDVTGFPEMLDGRVKTLHPKIHAAILADRDNPEHMRQLAEAGIEPIDMVVVNLYPFEKTIAREDCTFEEAIEMIDIGGPCLLRAAAKNHRQVVVLPGASHFTGALAVLRGQPLCVDEDECRLQLAFCAFWDVAAYDASVAEWFDSQCEINAPDDPLGKFFVRRFFNWGPLRYGENAHQGSHLCDISGAWLPEPVIDLTAADACYMDSQPDLSHNNWVDADAAVQLCAELSRATLGLPKSEGGTPPTCGTGFEPVKCSTGFQPVQGGGFGSLADEKHSRRNLPHIETPGKVYFVTFRLKASGELEPVERDIVLKACLHWHQSKMDLHAAVVMPDHVHLLLTPLESSPGQWVTLTEILHSIKRFTAAEINRLRGMPGALWQDERFDRIVRNEKEFLEKWEYIRMNACRRELVGQDDDYPWYWDETMPVPGMEDYGLKTRETQHRLETGATPGRETRHRLEIGATQYVCCFIKHTNACGVGVSTDSAEALRRAYLGDPNAAMGGVLAVNFDVNVEFATAVMETYQRWGKPLRDAGAANAPGGFFVEVWIAPNFDEGAVAVIRGEAESGPKKEWGKRVRLLEVGEMDTPPDPEELEYRSISGGMLVQSRDVIGLSEDQWRVVTNREPTGQELNDLRLAWLICKHTKSNAITICRDGMLIGNGAGQMSRVMSCRVATWLAQENGHLMAGNRERGTGNSPAEPVAASDAFFPFRDGLDVLVDAGVTAVIQPGGSKRDEEVIAACDERGVAMIFTGTRHFKH